jgi:hypothetical protein
MATDCLFAIDGVEVRRRVSVPGSPRVILTPRLFDRREVRAQVTETHHGAWPRDVHRDVEHAYPSRWRAGAGSVICSAPRALLYLRTNGSAIGAPDVSIQTLLVCVISFNPSRPFSRP